MRVTYKGPADRIRASTQDDWVNRGGEIDLSDTQIARLRATGHRFEAVDGRRNLPEPEPEEAETEAASEPEVTTEAAED